MTQKEKELLLIDICGRLPYGVKMKAIRQIGDDRTEVDEIVLTPMWLTTLYERIEDCKPYLRPMSSMTEGEIDEFLDIVIPVEEGKGIVEEEKIDRYVYFCNSHYLDWRNLIPMGLALEAPKDLYSNESEYDENGWKDLGNGLKVNRLGHVELTEEGRKKLEDLQYDKNGWKYLGNGLKMDRQGHIAGGLKLK